MKRYLSWEWQHKYKKPWGGKGSREVGMTFQAETLGKPGDKASICLVKIGQTLWSFEININFFIKDAGERYVVKAGLYKYFVGILACLMADRKTSKWSCIYTGMR